MLQIPITPRLMERLDEVVEVLVRNRQDRHQIYVSARQLMLAQRITTHLQGLLAGHVPRAGTMDQFGRDVALYGQVLKGLDQGSAGLDFEPISDLEARARLRESTTLYQRVSKQASALLATTPTLLGIENTLDTLKTRSDRLLKHSSALAATLWTYDRSIHTLGTIALVFCALAGLAMLWVVRRRACAERNTSNTGAQRPQNACGPAQSKLDAAAMPNSGAVKKKRSATNKGGVQSSDNGAVFT
jgi:twitching motility protein PilJ